MAPSPVFKAKEKRGRIEKREKQGKIKERKEKNGKIKRKDERQSNSKTEKKMRRE